MRIAGPCSAETREQVLNTAKALKVTGKVDILRAGIWKPRTRPGSFEGVGEIGLPWVAEASKLYKMPATVEVAKADHIEKCLKHGIDIFWIGARTTANPFAVQEIASALKGVDVPVLIKNPINPDLGLWIGAIERLEKEGVKEIGAIHRGFSISGEKYYRNRPLWHIPLELMRLRRELPILCDPSHICGRRDILADVSQKAMDLDFDGLMIESHINPDKAWSDAMQQITPQIYDQLIGNLILRKGYEDVPKIQNELEYLRGEINDIDDEIINLLSNRMKIARQIGSYKKENNITILQHKRWQEIREKYRKGAQKGALGNEFILDIINAIHSESIDQQEEVFREN